MNTKEAADLNQNHLGLPDSAPSFTTLSRKYKPTPVSTPMIMPGPPCTSMISHWNPTPVLPPNSITTMVTHSIRTVPSPTPLLCTAQEYQEMIDRIVGRAFAMLRWRSLYARIE